MCAKVVSGGRATNTLMRRMLAILGLVLLTGTTPAHARTCLIKGNINNRGERIYHVPGSKWYARTKINRPGERWFCTEEEAIAAGWRPPLDQPLSAAARRLWNPGGSMMALMGETSRDMRVPPEGQRRCRIKVNINARGECIYHVPGSRWYDRVRINRPGERWFCSVAEAIAAGCRAPHAR